MIQLRDLKYHYVVTLICMFLTGCESAVVLTGLKPDGLPADVLEVEVSPEEFQHLENVRLFAGVVSLLARHDSKHHILPTLTKGGASEKNSDEWQFEILRDATVRFLAYGNPSSNEREELQVLINDHNDWDSPARMQAVQNLKTISAFAWDFPLIKGDVPSCGIRAVSGRGAAFDPEIRQSLQALDDDTIILVESRDKDPLWWKPQETELLGNLEKSMKDEQRGIGSSHKFGFLVAFKDGTVWRLSHSIPVAELRKFMEVESARKHDRDTELTEWKCQMTYPGRKAKS